jgi:hypothetical protein
MRLRSNRLLYGASPTYRGIGRPPIYGDKFKPTFRTSKCNVLMFQQILQKNIHFFKY